jgi:hypothetical protein
MYNNNHQSSLLGLSYTLPSNVSNKPILLAPPGLIHPSLMNQVNHNSTSLPIAQSQSQYQPSTEPRSYTFSLDRFPNLYQVETQKLSSHDLFLNEDLMISNEITKLSNIYETLMSKKLEIDKHLFDIHSQISELIKKKEVNKRVMNISTTHPTLEEATSSRNTQQIAFKETVAIHSPVLIKSIDSNEPSESFIKSVQAILTKYPNILASDIQNKLSPEHRPPAGSRKFQSMLFKVPGVMAKEEKVITKNGTEMIENIFYLDNGFDKKILEEIKKPLNNIDSNWRILAIKEQPNFKNKNTFKGRECFRKMKGKPCKVNEKGFCNYCH